MSAYLVDSDGNLLTDSDGNPLVFGPPSTGGGLAPLAASQEADQVEADLKAAFMTVFENMIRPRLSLIELYGMPHRGEFQTIERFVKEDGLALQRQPDAEPFMRELFRGWRARNPRRGLHFLRFYLQLLWPGKWTLVQLWHDPAAPYPSGSSEVEGPGMYLTSRVRLYIDLEGGDPTGELLGRLQGGFRAVVPARIVLEPSVRELYADSMRMANICEEHESEDYTGSMAP